MFRAITNSALLCRNSVSKTRSLPSFSTSSVFNSDPTSKSEAPIIENEQALVPDEVRRKNALEQAIVVPLKVDLTPVSGVPAEHVRSRRVRIFRPAKNAMQSGTANTHHWEMEFDVRVRWENPLMGWTSTGDPLSNLKVQFVSSEDAIAHCEKHGWAWFIDAPKNEKPLKPKMYGQNFAWNKRSRVSTK